MCITNGFCHRKCFDRGFTATVQLRLKRRFTELLLSTVQHQCVDEIYYIWSSSVAFLLAPKNIVIVSWYTLKIMHPFIYTWTLIQNQGSVQTRLYCHYQWVQPRLLPQRSSLYRHGAHTRALLNLGGLFADIKTIDTNLIDIDKNRDAPTSRNTRRGRSLSCFDSAELGKMT